MPSFGKKKKEKAAEKAASPPKAAGGNKKGMKDKAKDKMAEPEPPWAVLAVHLLAPPLLPC